MEHPTRLYVAAGGGGDALAAMTLHAASAPGCRAVIATYAWDRLLIDPLPGPRPVGDFAGLEPVGNGLWRVTARSAATAPAGSTLPRLAGELDATVLLLDPYQGAEGLAGQLAEAVRVYRPQQVTLVDVGGDVLARGNERELKSPLADILALAALTRVSGIDPMVAVLGVGLDGELDPGYMRSRIGLLGGRPGPRLTAEHVAPVLPLLSWHPSEACGMLAAAASGVRGTVQIRDAGSLIALGEDTADSWLLDARALAVAGVLAPRLAASRTLDEAEAAVLEVLGRSELDYERRKAAQLGRAPMPDPAPERLRERYEAFLRDAARRSDLVTFRRMAEAVGAPRGAGFERWRADLIAAQPQRYARPLWRLRLESDTADCVVCDSAAWTAGRA